MFLNINTCYRKLQIKSNTRTGYIFHTELTTHLLRKDTDDFKTQSIIPLGIESCGQSSTIVLDPESDFFAFPAQGNLEMPCSPISKRMFEAIGDSFIDDEGHWHHPFFQQF